MLFQYFKESNRFSLGNVYSSGNCCVKLKVRIPFPAASSGIYYYYIVVHYEEDHYINHYYSVFSHREWFMRYVTNLNSVNDRL